MHHRITQPTLSIPGVKSRRSSDVEMVTSYTMETISPILNNNNKESLKLTTAPFLKKNVNQFLTPNIKIAANNHKHKQKDSQQYKEQQQYKHSKIQSESSLELNDGLILNKQTGFIILYK